MLKLNFRTSISNSQLSKIPGKMPSSIHIPHGSPTTHRALIYFVPGNPGLIDFYTPFLPLLSSFLQASPKLTPQATSYDIYGRDLLGFSDSCEPFNAQNLPFELEGQIEGIHKDVEEKGREYDFVIMMGHSVGAYIATEIMYRHLKSRSPTILKHGVLLFPTLTHIALSPSGKRVTTLRHIPHFETNFHIIARAVLTLFSSAFLTWFAQKILGFSEHAAQVVGRWLKSRDGVWQSIHLGLSEMEGIRGDIWGRELWEVAGDGDKGSEGSEKKTSVKRKAKFFALYAKSDHWVADHIRDDFIHNRKDSGMRVEIDETGIPHAFCTREGM